MEEQKRSADEILNKVIEDPARLEELKNNPLPELAKLRDEAVKEVQQHTRAINCFTKSPLLCSDYLR